MGKCVGDSKRGRAKGRGKELRRLGDSLEETRHGKHKDLTGVRHW